MQQLQNDSLLFIPIDSIHISTLETLASNNMYLPGVYSRNILLANGLSDYEEPVVLPDPFKSVETRKDYSKLGFDEVKRSFLLVYPNPTRHYFIAEYHLDRDYNDLYLEILDVTANKIGELNIEGKQNQAVIPVKDLKPGIYFIRLIAGGVVMDTQKMIIL